MFQDVFPVSKTRMENKGKPEKKKNCLIMLELDVAKGLTLTQI